MIHILGNNRLQIPSCHPMVRRMGKLVRMAVSDRGFVDIRYMAGRCFEGMLEPLAGWLEFAVRTRRFQMASRFFEN